MSVVRPTAVATDVPKFGTSTDPNQLSIMTGLSKDVPAFRDRSPGHFRYSSEPGAEDSGSSLRWRYRKNPRARSSNLVSASSGSICADGERDNHGDDPKELFSNHHSSLYAPEARQFARARAVTDVLPKQVCQYILHHRRYFELHERLGPEGIGLFDEVVEL